MEIVTLSENWKIWQWGKIANNKQFYWLVKLSQVWHKFQSMGCPLGIKLIKDTGAGGGQKFGWLGFMAYKPL